MFRKGNASKSTPRWECYVRLPYKIANCQHFFKWKRTLKYFQ
jgi:hypothetical protein